MPVLEFMQFLHKVLLLFQFLVLYLKPGIELVELSSVLGELGLERSHIQVVNGDFLCFLFEQSPVELIVVPDRFVALGPFFVPDSVEFVVGLSLLPAGVVEGDETFAASDFLYFF
jgi:hypothetical protein